MPLKVTVGWLLALLVWLGSVGTALSADALESEILAYEQQDRLFPPPKGAIVVTGSSTINRWYSMRNDLAPLDIIPRGLGGSTADDLDYYLERIVLTYAPRAAVIYEGDNDIAWGLMPQYVASRISQIAGRISARFPSARVYVISIKPSPLRWGLWPQMQQANQLLAEFCASDPRYQFIDTASALLGADGLPIPEYYASDTLHLSAAGYAAWTGAVRPALMAGEQSSIVVPNLQGQDLGAVGVAGSSSESGGVYTVRGSGDDVWGTSDEFRYVWQSLVGDGQITARVVSQTNTATWAKAGVMLREQLTTTSRHAFMLVTPAAGSHLLYRTATGGTTGPSSPNEPGIAAPYWVRLVRKGDVVTGYNSPDGITWTERGSVTLSSLPSTVYIGLAVSSLNDGVLGTALFDNVYVYGSTAPPPVVDVTPPTIPTGLQATAAGPNQINLNWTASSDSGTGVAGYRIFRDGVQVGTAATTTYADTGLSANTLYTYTVSAYDGAVPANESQPSAAANTTTLATPVLSSPGNQSGTVGAAASLQIAATDADGDSLTYSATGLPAGLAIDASTGRITGSPTTAGTYNVTVAVSDGRGGSDTAGFTWTVVVAPPVNVAPVLTSPGNQVGTVGVVVNILVVATDANGDTLAFTASGLPAGLAMDTVTGRITGTPTAAGTSSATVAVSDGRGGSDTSTFTWTVTTANIAPTLTSPGNQSGTVGVAVSVAVTATDADGDALAFAANGLPAGLTIDAANGRIGGTPTAAGTWNVTLAVSDGRGGSDSATVAWTVAAAKPSGGGGGGGGSLGWAGTLFIGLAGLVARRRSRITVHMTGPRGAPRGTRSAGKSAAHGCDRRLTRLSPAAVSPAAAAQDAPRPSHGYAP